MTEEKARAHPGVLAGTHYYYRDRERPGGWTVKSRAARLAAQARYDASENGRSARARYDASEKRRATRDRYNNSFKGWARNISMYIRQQQRAITQLREEMYGA